MKQLILIKHAPPEVDPSIPSDQWRLGEKGRAACAPLAERLHPFAIGQIITSTEPKAIETGQELARLLNVNIDIIQRPDLHEHDRSNVPHMRSGDFISMMELFFRRPDERVLGKETADEVFDRIDEAVEKIVNSATHDTVAVVTHGTVLALFLHEYGARKTEFELWRSMGLPSYAVMDMPDYRITEIVERL